MASQKSYQILMICAAVVSDDPALSLRYAQSLFSQRVALNVAHGKLALSTLVIVYPLVLHDFMHSSLAPVVDAAVPNFSSDLPGFHALNLFFKLV